MRETFLMAVNRIPGVHPRLLYKDCGPVTEIRAKWNNFFGENWITSVVMRGYTLEWAFTPLVRVTLIASSKEQQNFKYS